MVATMRLVISARAAPASRTGRTSAATRTPRGIARAPIMRRRASASVGTPLEPERVLAFVRASKGRARMDDAQVLEPAAHLHQAEQGVDRGRDRPVAVGELG